MKLSAVTLLLFCSSFVHDFNLLREAPSSRFLVRFPRLAWLLPNRNVDWRTVISAASKKHNVPAPFVKSIIAAESNFDCCAVSAKGAIGPMQLMPETAQLFGADPTVPEQNIDAGTHYLQVLLSRYGKSRNRLKRVIAAYNAGPGVVDRYRGVPPYRETRTYVKRVLAFLQRFERERG
jgi:soluble lytic murein transglycosylase-like protein